MFCSRKQTISRGLLISAVSGTHSELLLPQRKLNFLLERREYFVCIGILGASRSCQKNELIIQQSQGRGEKK